MKRKLEELYYYNDKRQQIYNKKRIRDEQLCKKIKKIILHRIVTLYFEEDGII